MYFRKKYCKNVPFFFPDLLYLQAWYKISSLKYIFNWSCLTRLEVTVTSFSLLSVAINQLPSFQDASRIKTTIKQDLELKHSGTARSKDSISTSTNKVLIILNNFSVLIPSLSIFPYRDHKMYTKHEKSLLL